MTRLQCDVRTSAAVGVSLALALLIGCGGASTQTPAGPGAAGSVATNGGQSATAGGASSSNAGAGPSAGASLGGSSDPGSAGAAAIGGGGTATGNTATGGTATGGNGPVAGAPSTGPAITWVAKSEGCGTPFGGVSGAKITIQTMGTKAADCADKLNGAPVCGNWSLPRDYYVNLPANYDFNKAYPLVLGGPGCGGNGTNIYPLPNLDAIRVGLTPPPNSIGHATNENQGCFDDREGDDSVDFIFYETLYDALNKQLCFDRNRVFAMGNSSGSTLSNELGCKYAGDALRPVRGVMLKSGTFPSEPAFAPTCSSAPMAGLWVHEVNDATYPFDNAKAAITRAMAVNHCDKASYDSAVSENLIENFPIGGGNPDDTCKKLKGCDSLYPLVVCALPGSGIGGRDNVVNPGFAIFVKMFGLAPFLTDGPPP